ncbi:MtfA peptidase [Tenacibaculum sp. 190524A05c]|uniref:M90 family metallopeptidase n=1 Tax=Tenacibaculum platacis TaxID=3137852 RepID=UPI0031FABCE2
MIYIIITVIVLLIIYSSQKKENKKIVAENRIEIQEHWYTILEENVLFYQKLNEEDRLHFKKRIQSFLNSVEIVAVDFELEDLDILLVAASAIIPVFGFNNWMYPNLKTVIIYPDYFNENLEFAAKSENKIIGGLVGNGMFENKMILSRRALHHGFLNKTDKGNTGIHEFVHLLDKLDGNIDGIPKALIDNENLLQWLDVVHDKMEAINNDDSDIRNYGGTSKEEFFAVACEYFFERPMLLKRKHPKLYQMLQECFSVE